MNRKLAIPLPDQMAQHLAETVMTASARHSPRGARADPKPWALVPELATAVAERREARVPLRR